MGYVLLKKSSLYFNTVKMLQIAKAWNAQLCVVTKFCLSEKNIINALVSAGCTSIADSNMRNFEELPKEISINLKKSLIKTTHTAIESIGNLSRQSRPQRLFISDTLLLAEIRNIPNKKRPEIVLTIEIGDLKDGIYPQEVENILKEYNDLPIIGVSANFACLSGTLPTMKDLKKLHAIAQKIQVIKNLEKPFVSIGGTVVYTLLKNEEPQKNYITEIRCGEGIFFGNDSSSNLVLKDFKHDIFTFYAEIIEVSKKYIPEKKESGLTALGEKAQNRPCGERIQAVLNFGVLAADKNHLILEDKDTFFCGQTFDFSVIDITNSKKAYKAGDVVKFFIDYHSASFLFMNQFISMITQKE